MRMQERPGLTVIDFFAGIGLVRYALERRGWHEIYALDYSPLKQRMYAKHFGADQYVVEDIHTVDAATVPSAVLAHASFPCTDTSVAGSRQGLAGRESSAFWGFIRVLRDMGDKRPPLVLLENVEGFLTSHTGNDLRDALAALNDLGYCVDLMLINALHFVPQSRVRLFVVGMRGLEAQDIFTQEAILSQPTNARPDKIRRFIQENPQIDWFLSELPALPPYRQDFAAIIDHDEPWWPQERSAYLLQQMHVHHKEKLAHLIQQSTWTYGTAFRRMRVRDGLKQSTAEIRLDGIAGCLRTPKGGSARQIVIRAGFGQFNARLLNAVENARLMGADQYHLASDVPLNDALFGFGDAVCVPVIEWIAEHVLEPLLLTIPTSV
ncbi:MAG: DNA cytosine methyltransferase [Oscillochloridaceae bacterium umkhey_bin13]